MSSAVATVMGHSNDRGRMVVTNSSWLSGWNLSSQNHCWYTGVWTPCHTRASLFTESQKDRSCFPCLIKTRRQPDLEGSPWTLKRCRRPTAASRRWCGAVMRIQLYLPLRDERAICMSCGFDIHLVSKSPCVRQLLGDFNSWRKFGPNWIIC